MLRYIVERISDGAFLELELPIVVTTAGKKLCGAGAFSGEVLPIAEAYRHAGSKTLIDPRATYIHEEADGIIRNTWLVTRSSFEGARWKIEGQGFSSYFSGYPYEGEYHGVKVDPIAVARHVVEYAQAKTGANIGVKVTGASSVRRGTDSDLKADAAKKIMDAKKASWDEYAKPRKALEAKVATASKPFDAAILVLNRDRRVLKDAYAAAIAAKAPAATIAAKKKLVDTKSTEIKTKREAKEALIKSDQEKIAGLKSTEAPLEESYEAAKADYDAARQKADTDKGAWKILWWDTPYCLDAMVDAITEAGYEWVEWSGWNSDRTRVLKEIRCLPRIGEKRTDLAFIEGANITEQVSVTDDVSKYANSVTVLGAGEGKSALRAEVGLADGRRRTPVVVAAKHLTKQSLVEALARSELAARSASLKISAIRIDARHPNAPRGTFGVGDTILVDIDAGWLGRQRLWARISEIEWNNLAVADLVLEVAA
ncbi:hypothetical protein G7068_08285 [Leucobacter viscericola]|uniref:Uncharacterized protein n=1 Tax=Leucobacter viscericola TaxID=2714935 RepID=A0A6G7XF66_9MICO|nr:hypothetical protein [Leucobacter viscericola]QIK63193.1 hypothetical protein G7068_08285 [Leucobacter viscericola]